MVDNKKFKRCTQRGGTQCKIRSVDPQCPKKLYKKYKSKEHKTSKGQTNLTSIFPIHIWRQESFKL